MEDPASMLHCTGEALPLVLASSSPRRRLLLESLGLSFEVDPCDVPETIAPGADVRSVVLELALAKARQVVLRHPQALIIAADTLVALEVDIFGKPRDATDAARMLQRLSGRAHSVFTGLVVLDSTSQRCDSRLVESEVWFRGLSQSEIDAYVSTGESLDKAGSYGSQGLGAVFIDKIIGDYFNVVGLPLATLNELLRAAGCCIICRRLRDEP